MSNRNNLVEQPSEDNKNDNKQKVPSTPTASNKVPAKVYRQPSDNVQQPSEPRPEPSPPSTNELLSLDSSFEQVWLAKPDAPLKAPYSEQTVKRMETIRQLAEQQEIETKEKLDKLGPQSCSLPVANTSFGNDLDEIRESIRKVCEHEEEAHWSKLATGKTSGPAGSVAMDFSSGASKGATTSTEYVSDFTQAQSASSAGSGNNLSQAKSTSPINLQAWDTKLGSSNVDYEKLYQEMLKAKESSPVDNVDILWRLAKVTYLVSLNLLDQNAIKEKTQEVLIYAEKALVLEESNFQANLWLASALGKLALMECDLQLKLKSFAAFLKHLAICAKQNGQDHLVLFMEGRLHLALLLLSNEEKASIEQHLNSHNLPVPVFDFTTAEAKLRKSLELNPNLLDSYITLAYLLVKCKKFVEAVEVIDKALTVPRVTKSDEMLAKDMEQLKARLPPN